ncbi:hypothetical protein CBR_g49972 [Chara braunii]|uniref:Bromo domain-containing protein n=1 Tax=Chara braunii TaxID=69332 RepID=A0A388K542_CHABU|nr:hypothetical protein CBR_g49972 [Chara braunii]|eukprot:GBG65178.1 hypothetical protein CBR_g49972 [Chara braunii]
MGGEVGRAPKREWTGDMAFDQQATSSLMQDKQLKRMLKRKVQDLTSKVEEMERQVLEVMRMRASVRKNRALAGKAATAVAVSAAAAGSTIALTNGGPGSKDKKNAVQGKGAQNPAKLAEIDKAKQEAARAKRMQDLIRQSGNILRQLMQHKWAWPFLKPVDVEGLGLHDYFDVIKKPMDLGTIRDRMDATDGTRYEHPQQICDDIRLVFSNAMTYNQEGTDVYVMARTLSEKFEEKWRTSLEPKLNEEANRRRDEEALDKVREMTAKNAVEEAEADKLADNVGRELEVIDKELEDLKGMTMSKCRPMTIEEKRQLGHNLGKLPPDRLNRVIQIIAQSNPNFDMKGDEVEVDIDAQTPGTLWRLHRFVQSCLRAPRVAGAAAGGMHQGHGPRGGGTGGSETMQNGRGAAACGRGAGHPGKRGGGSSVVAPQ